jgi:hypothetical protein
VAVADTTVHFTVSESSGSDFVAAANEGDKTVTIPTGSFSVTHSVPTVDDANEESSGSVTVTLKFTNLAGIRTRTASVTVNDNDTPPPVPNLTVAPVSGETTKLDVSWNEVSSTASYLLNWKTSNQSSYPPINFKVIQSTDPRSYQISGLGVRTA